MLWQERGPIYDSVGPSNGNTRGNDLYTSGRMAAVLVDTLNDPSGNTAIVGGVSGGLEDHQFSLQFSELEKCE
jgi:hypothetical protein